jgi:hypothetical protein
LPTVFASVSVTILLFYAVTLAMAYGHLLPPGAHMLWGFFMTILIVLLQCLIFGFFIGSGKSIKRVVEEQGLSPEWVQRTKDYKNQAYPALMLAILAAAAAGIVGGGVVVKAVPLFVHEALVWVSLALNARSLLISYRVISRNVEAIHRINEEVGEGGGRAPQASPAPPRGEARPRTQPPPASKFYFLAAAAWVPFLYMRWSLGNRAFPSWPFLLLSLGLLAAGLWVSLKRPRA